MMKRRYNSKSSSISSLMFSGGMMILLLVMMMVAVLDASNNQQQQPTTVTTKEYQIFNEEMMVKVLPKGRIYSHVQFSTVWSSDFNDKSTFQHYDLFPRSIGDLITRIGVEEMTLQFTQGRWNYIDWGYPVRSAPVGVELTAWFKSLPNKGVDSQWRELTHSLSGLFCSSMQFLYKVPYHTSSPKRSFKPEGISNIYHGYDDSYYPAIYNMETNTTNPLEIRYGILPRESVCTENLTPWLKLLPCRGQSGIAKLLNPLKLYDVNYHSMSITIRKICKDRNDLDCKLSPKLEVIQTLSVVNDLSLKDRNNKIEIELDSLFGINDGLSSCPLATNSKVYIDNQYSSLSVHPKPTTTSTKFSVYDLTKFTKDNTLKLKLNWDKKLPDDNSNNQKSIITTPITAHSHITGYGQERGGIAIQIYNHHQESIEITYYHPIPWYLTLYFHTFKFKINDIVYNDFKYKYILPSEIRSSPSILEISFRLPSHSVASMSIDFDKVFLHYTEHPPDANRGFDLGSGIVTAYLSSNQDESIDIEWSPNMYQEKPKDTLIPVRIYTEALLITLPTPDFSMLYNVITLTGTVFALFFGSMINIMIRRLKHTFTGEDFVSDRPIAKIYRKLSSFFSGGQTLTSHPVSSTIQ